MGFADEKKIASIYDSFDIFTFPSIHEGFGMPVLEAQARELPVVTYTKGRMPEEVIRYCFKAADEKEMARIFVNLKAVGYNSAAKKLATAYARSFTWKKTAQKTQEVYATVVKKEGPFHKRI